MIRRSAFAVALLPLAARAFGDAGRARQGAQAPAEAATPDEAVAPGRALVFPGDHGAHPGSRVEWWYLTGWLDPAGDPWGVQVTVFRVRTSHASANPSRFAPHQLLLAHAAIVDPTQGLRMVQRTDRAGFGIATASRRDTALLQPGFAFARDAQDVYHVRVDSPRLALEIAARPRGAPMLQGDAGYSRKSRNGPYASYYYSRPQLDLRATARLGSRRRALRGVGWLDHEWSSEALPPSAVGWMWTGLNMADGSALVAFRIRDAKDREIASYARWTGRADDPEPRFDALRHWRSPRTGASYPVALAIEAGGRRILLEPLLDDQEIDARASTGNIYWEGAVRAMADGAQVGLGYLELTGYAGRQAL